MGYKIDKNDFKGVPDSVKASYIRFLHRNNYRQAVNGRCCFNCAFSFTWENRTKCTLMGMTDFKAAYVMQKFICNKYH